MRNSIVQSVETAEFIYHPPKIALTATGLTHKTKETGFLAGDFADEIWISGSETRFLRKS